MELINERKELYSDLIHKVLSGAKLNTFLSYTVDKSVILRHDVDNSIDDAVIMAEFEKKMGIKSTYFILHTAKYFNYSEKLIENCVAIQNYGHDIGFHNNSITLNVKRKIPIEKAINKPLNFLRKNGLVVRGTSAHGVPDCYLLQRTLSRRSSFWNLRKLSEIFQSPRLRKPLSIPKREIRLGRLLPLPTSTLAFLILLV